MVQDTLNARAELQSKREEEGIENEIFRVVKNIKQEISEMGGICAAPLNVNDVSLECARHLIPDSLYLLLRLMITSDITIVSEVFASKAECKNSNEERLVISIAQIKCTAVRDARSVTKKSALLCDIIQSNKLDILAVTETWINSEINNS